MVRAVLACVLLATIGCAGSKPDLNPLASEVGRIQEEARGFSEDETSAGLLETSESFSSQYESAENTDAAGMALHEARASGRASLAASMVYRWESDADACRRATADVRREWQDALAMLVQAEKVAERKARGVTREEPAPDPMAPLPDLIPVPTEVAPEPSLISTSSQEWKLAAREYGVPTSDIDGAVISALTVAADPKAEPLVRDHQLRMAAWSVLELGYRVQGEAARRECPRALREGIEIAGYRDQALWAMVDLERSMKEGVRQELEDELKRQADRENALYESLKQFEGKFASIRKEARGTIMSLSDILFDFGKSDLRRDAEINLAKVAVILMQYPEMHIIVEGHTDNVGSEKYNLELSEKRAQAVYDFLITQDIEETRLETAGFGFSQPVAANDTPEGRQQNRRVDLVIREE